MLELGTESLDRDPAELRSGKASGDSRGEHLGVQRAAKLVGAGSLFNPLWRFEMNIILSILAGLNFAMAFVYLTNQKYGWVTVNGLIGLFCLFVAIRI